MAATPSTVGTGVAYPIDKVYTGLAWRGKVVSRASAVPAAELHHFPRCRGGDHWDFIGVAAQHGATSQERAVLPRAQATWSCASRVPGGHASAVRRVASTPLS